MNEPEQDRKPRRRGQVIPLGQGKFKIRVPLGRDGTGKRTYHNETLHDSTPTKAQRRCETLLAEVESGAYFRAAPLTVKEYLEDKWLPHKRREELRPATLRSYEQIVRCHVMPRLGALPLGDVRRSHVQDLYDALQDDRLAFSTRKLTKTVLRMAFRQAITWELLRDNPAAGIRVVGKGRPAPMSRAFRVTEAVAFIEAASREMSDLPYLIQLTTGMRPEELLGLRNSDVELVREADARTGAEFERGRASVRQVAIKVKGGWQFLPPKTENGKRALYFPARLYHQLEAYADLRAEQRRVAGSAWTEHDLVFPSPSGWPQNQQGRYTHRFKALVKAAGLPAEFTPYSLRYSFATLALLAGELDKAVSAQMGHATVDFTKEVYVQVLPEMQQSLSDRFEQLLFTSTRTPLAHQEVEGTM